VAFNPLIRHRPRGAGIRRLIRRDIELTLAGELIRLPCWNGHGSDGSDPNRDALPAPQALRAHVENKSSSPVTPNQVLPVRFYCDLPSSSVRSFTSSCIASYNHLGTTATATLQQPRKLANSLASLTPGKQTATMAPISRIQVLSTLLSVIFLSLLGLSAKMGRDREIAMKDFRSRFDTDGTWAKELDLE
jgi:hypothetical protein